MAPSDAGPPPPLPMEKRTARQVAWVLDHTINSGPDDAAATAARDLAEKIKAATDKDVRKKHKKRLAKMAWETRVEQRETTPKWSWKDCGTLPRAAPPSLTEAAAVPPRVEVGARQSKRRRMAQAAATNKTASGDDCGEVASGDEGGKVASGDDGGKVASGDEEGQVASGDEGGKVASVDEGGMAARGDEGGKVASGDDVGKVASSDGGSMAASGEEGGKVVSGDDGGKVVRDDDGGEVASLDNGGEVESLDDGDEVESGDEVASGDEGGMGAAAAVAPAFAALVGAAAPAAVAAAAPSAAAAAAAQSVVALLSETAPPVNAPFSDVFPANGNEASATLLRWVQLSLETAYHMVLRLPECCSGFLVVDARSAKLGALRAEAPQHEMELFLGLETGVFDPACINLLRSVDRYSTLETISRTTKFVLLGCRRAVRMEKKMCVTRQHSGDPTKLLPAEAILLAVPAFDPPSVERLYKDGMVVAIVPRGLGIKGKEGFKKRQASWIIHDVWPQPRTSMNNIGGIVHGAALTNLAGLQRLIANHPCMADGGPGWLFMSSRARLEMLASWLLPVHMPSFLQELLGRVVLSSQVYRRGGRVYIVGENAVTDVLVEDAPGIPPRKVQMKTGTVEGGRGTLRLGLFRSDGSGYEKADIDHLYAVMGVKVVVPSTSKMLPWSPKITIELSSAWMDGQHLLGDASWGSRVIFSFDDEFARRLDCLAERGGDYVVRHTPPHTWTEKQKKSSVFGDWVRDVREW